MPYVAASGGAVAVLDDQTGVADYTALISR
jgi:hypothetical protein